MKKIILLVATIFYATISFSQIIYRCAFDDLYFQNINKYPGYEQSVANTFNLAKSIATAASKTSSGCDTIFQIPVVVHVVYNSAAQNIDDSLIQNQIEVLNQDFRRKNADTGNIRSIFSNLGADAGIEFFLADVDPNGNPTTGITRTQTARASFSAFGDILSGQIGADEVKADTSGGINAWDPDRYLNIWVCNLEDNLGQVLGLAYPPDGAPNWPQDTIQPNKKLHGVVIHYKAFGRNNPNATGQLAFANRGRTVTHEVGHYLGLRHIWGQDDLLAVLLGYPDCNSGDGIDDTPNAGSNTQQIAMSASGCNISTNTCDDGPGDLPDMWENYMDYSKEECQNIFTYGQVAIMRQMLKISRTQLAKIKLEPQNICNPDTTTGIFQDHFQVQIFPNPASEKISIRQTFKTPQRIVLTDIYGKIVFEKLTSPSENETILDVRNFSSGVYFVNFSVAVNGKPQKIIVQR